MTTEEQIKRGISFLEDANHFIENFVSKLQGKEEFLRTATISHLGRKANGNLTYGEASTLIDEWIEQKKKEDVSDD